MSLRAVLTYHSLDSSGSPISIPPASFASHLKSLTTQGVRVLSVDALLNEVRTGDDHGDAVAITFDDGFANFGDHGAPVLREFGLPATVFVVSQFVGKTNTWRGRGDPGSPTLPLLGWDAVGRLPEAGITIGAHTRTHPRLDAIPPAAVEEEMAGCAEELMARVGQRPTTFAYPYGALSPTAVECAQRNFAAAFSTRFRALTTAPDPALVPRLDAYYFRHADGLRRWGSPRFRAYIQARAIGRSIRTVLE